jgi:hypothetical protein
MGGRSRNVALGAALAAASVVASMTPGRIAPALAANNAPVLSYWSTVDNPFPQPAPNRMVTVYGFFLSNLQPVKGVRMATIWRDDHDRAFCYSRTDASGIASCTERLPHLQFGNSLEISVTFYYKGATYTTSSSALPT